MGLQYSPRIVTSGLILYLDAANPKSYPGTGTYWFDLTGNNNNGTLIGGATFDSANKGSIVFDGTDDYISLGTNKASLIQGRTALTVGIMFKLNANASLRGLIGTSAYSCQYNLGLVANNGALSFYNDYTTCYAASIGSYVPVGAWIYAVGTYDGVTTTVYGIKDGILTSTSGTSKSGATNTFVQDFQIMRGGSYFSNGNVALAFMYDRVLSQTEIVANYNNFKGRFS